MKVNRDRFRALFSERKKRRILVFGDIILDHYIFGQIRRISPEAPVPILEVTDEKLAAGGSANVALNLSELGFNVQLSGLIGEDADGEYLDNMLRKKGVGTEFIQKDRERPTSKKSRMIAQRQQVVRVDREVVNPISSDLAGQFMDRLTPFADMFDVIIFQDYNKGLLTKELILSALALFKDKIVAVDPKYHHFFDFTGVTLFKPNVRELRQAFGIMSGETPSLDDLSRRALEMLQCENMLLTQGEKGMTLYEKRGGSAHIPTRAKVIYDVSGAGDTVISVVGGALACGASMQEAATLGNYAAGVVVAKLGVAPITYQELFHALPSD
ncbi:MAG: hypothetical protein B6244_06320 [Candidatus Cloacimonetes bacterium 4572_55]|nr:MAG: hypothetical protein B6244_06320 [Candidatus Cloacimonetes bacterium 4572_55]